MSTRPATRPSRSVSNRYGGGRAVTAALLIAALTPLIAAAPSQTADFSSNAGVYTATNIATELSVQVTSAGLTVSGTPDGGPLVSLTLSVTAVGRRGSLGSPGAAELSSSSNRVDVVRGSLTEWVINSTVGVKHGFTLANAPIGATEPVIVRLTRSGALRPWIDEAGTGVLFRDGRGMPVLAYTGLAATDSRNRSVPVWFEIEAGALDIVLDDATASYPITIDPLLTTGVFTRLGTQKDGYFGFSVGTAGDINGDGFSDVIVGAPNHDVDSVTEIGEEEGKIFIYFGKTDGTGLESSPDWSATQSSSGQNGARFGHAIAVANVNGNAIPDIVVGIPGYSNGQLREGAVYVYYDPVKGESNRTSASWSVESGVAGAELGTSVALADVNSSGHSDLFAGAPLWDSGSGRPGAVLGWLGSSTGLPASPSTTPLLTGSQNGMRFGYSVASAGDVNADGYRA